MTEAKGLSKPVKLKSDLAALLQAVRKVRPAAAKGAYIRKVVLASTMGPGVKIDPSAAAAMEVAESQSQAETALVSMQGMSAENSGFF